MLKRTPVTVLAGPLGSGKTTLLNGLLKERLFAGTIVVLSELGAVNPAHVLVAHAGAGRLPATGGSSSLRKDMAKALAQAEERVRRDGRRMRRVVLETSGQADLAAIADALSSDPALRSYCLDGIVVAVDAVRGAAIFDLHPESIRQAALADCLVLTRADLASPPELAALGRRLDAINPAAQRLQAQSGRIDARTLLAASTHRPDSTAEAVDRWLNESAYAACTATGEDAHPGPGPAAAASPRRHDDMHAFLLTTARAIPLERFEAWLNALNTALGSRIVRVKGLLHVAGRRHPVLVHSVQHLMYPGTSLAAWSGKTRRSALAFTTDGIRREIVESSFFSLVANPGETAP